MISIDNRKFEKLDVFNLDSEVICYLKNNINLTIQYITRVIRKFYEYNDSDKDISKRIILLFEYTRLNGSKINLDKFKIYYPINYDIKYKEYCLNKTKKFKNRIEYWQSEGFSYEQAVEKVKEYQTRSVEDYILKYGEAEGKKRYEDVKKSFGKPNQIQYWISKGMTELEAKNYISKKQSTFSLEKCIEKYGEAEGLKIFNARQNKWQTTLKSKSEEEIKNINIKKGRDSEGNFHESWHKRVKIDDEFANSKCYFYFIKLYNDDEVFYKFGITKNKLYQRFSSVNKYYRIQKLYIIEGNYKTSTQIEKHFLEKTKNNIYTSKNLRSRETRIFNETELKEILKEIECISLN